MKYKRLNVLIEGKKAGVVEQDSNGAHSFKYDRSYRGVPLSSAMPLSTKIYRDKIVTPYMWGLLPEDSITREHVALEAKVSPNNPFALLSVIGLDCPGAVQFCLGDAQTSLKEKLVPLSESDIAHRLMVGRKEKKSWITHKEHWSLGGQQNKFALRKQGNRWFLCEGSAATTHIFKSGVSGLEHQALNEYVCMCIAQACGVYASKVQYCEFEGTNGSEPAIIIERYDRFVSKKSVKRLHQEDFCQALGCMPDNKYTMFGGPSSSDIINLLLTTGSKAKENVGLFLQMLFINYLLAATDAHAKNYSLMLKDNGLHCLAPMYDVASIAPYVELAQWKKKAPKLAMSIGGENRVGYLSREHIRKMINQHNLGEMEITVDGCTRLISLYADIIPAKLAEVFNSLEGTKSAKASRELRARMEKPIINLCKKTKDRIEV